MTIQRQHPRYAHEAALVVYVDGEGRQGRTKNVSRGGLCADLADPLAVGQEIEVDIQLVFDEETQSEPLRLAGRVAWCTPVDQAHQIGIVFKPLDRERAEDLSLFLRYLDDGTPVQRERRESNVDKRFG